MNIPETQPEPLPASWWIQLATSSSVFGTVTEQWAVVDAQGREVCRTSGFGDDRAKAELMAAAPRMRDALQAVALEPYPDSDARSLLDTLRLIARQALTPNAKLTDAGSKPL